MSTKPNVSVRVASRFNSPPERVFDAWLNPEMIDKWMFGPAVREEEVVHAAIDARVAGLFSFMVRRQGEDIDHVGQYLEIDRPRRLVFTWGVPKYSPDSSQVAIDIVPAAPGCELALTHELHPTWAHYARQTEEGWTKMLKALAKALGEIPA